MELLREMISDYTLRNVALGCLILGAMSGALGSFAVLRKQGLMGDALAHAALPGICFAYIATGGGKSPLILMIGAAVSGWIAMAMALVAIRKVGVDSGTALAVALTSFFGLGAVLLSVIQGSNDSGQAGLDKFLFGQAAALTSESVVVASALFVASMTVVVALFKEFKIISFDPVFAQSTGLPVGALGAGLTGLMVVAVVVGLNTVGVVLMSAMLVAPGATARLWTNRLDTMVILSGLIGGGCGLVGAVASVVESKVPTGPVIVLALAVAFGFSAFFGSARGAFWKRRRESTIGGVA